MVLIVKPISCKMYTYFSRRRGLLFKGLLLIGTVWLTVAVLILMENREKAVEREHLNPRHQALVYEAAADNEIDVDQRLEADMEEEDPLEPAIGEEKEQPQQDDEFHVKKGVKLYGEYGKPVVIPTNLTSDVQKLVNEGWQKNAFNQYVSDLISLHRKLPDPRDEWQVNFFSILVII